MFDKFKKQVERGNFSAKSITATVVFGAIILVFVLFGFQGKHTAVGTGAAARVNETYISVADFQSETNRLEQMYGQLFGGAGGMGAQRQFLHQQALETLVNSEILSQAAKKEGVLATDAEVRDFILTEMKVFQKDGKFQKDVYEQILAANHMTPPDFEDKVRKDIHRNRSQRVFQIVAAPTVLEIEKLKQLKENKTNLSYVKLDMEKLKSTYNISANEVTEKLKDENFLKRVQDEFAKQKSELNQEEQVKAQHILIKSKQGDAASEKVALDKIQMIREKAKSEDFGKLAAQYTEDEGSKSNKGLLDFFGRGRMVPEFEKAAFSQNVGVVGEPVKTAYGYHLIKVLDKKSAKEANFDEAKNQMAKRVLASDSIQLDIKKLEEALAKSDTASLDVLIKKLGLSWEETGYFEMDADVIPKLGSPELMKAANEVTKEKPLLPRLIHDRDTKWIVKLKDMKKEASTDDKNMVSQISRERSNELLSSWIDGVRKKSDIELNPQVLQ